MKRNQKQSKTVDTITDKNMLKFMTKISKKCKPKNTCLVSYNQVQYLKDLSEEAYDEFLEPEVSKLNLPSLVTDKAKEKAIDIIIEGLKKKYNK